MYYVYLYGAHKEGLQLRELMREIHPEQGNPIMENQFSKAKSTTREKAWKNLEDNNFFDE